MFRLLATVSLAALAIAGALPSAEAYVRSGPGVMPHGHHRLATPGGVSPPLDGMTAASGAYSLRKLRSAYAGSAVKLQRVDTTTQDIGFTAAGDFNTAAATTFCTTACGVTTWYDQSGNGRDLVQATAANQPVVVFSCVNAFACLQTTLSTQLLAGPTVTPATGVVSLAAYYNRAAGTTQCQYIRENGAGNRLNGRAGSPGLTLLGGASGSISQITGAADGAWHSAVGVVNGASSTVATEGGSTSGTVTGSVTAGGSSITGATSATCNQTEALFWDNYVLSGAENSGFIANQQAYWTR